MRRAWRELLGGCGLGVVLIGPAVLLLWAGAHPVTSWADEAPASFSSTCAHLRVTVGRGGAAAGTAYTQLVFRNAGRSCVVTGYPAVTLAGPAGAVTATPTNVDGEPVAPVRLRHGGMAVATVGVQDPSAAGCAPWQITTARVRASRHTVSVRFHTAACAGGVLVTPFRGGVQ